MAWNFGAQINALTQFDGNDTGASEEGENYSTLATQWLTDAAKEVMNLLPPDLKMECATITELTSSTPMDLDATGEIFHVTRENADDGYHVGCRKVNPIYAGSADDSTSLHYATATDPVYWSESDTSGDPKLFVKPNPSANQPARVHHMTFPSVSYNGTSIVNFPDEAEYLVVLRAAITAAQYKLNFEEDVELYAPILSSLKVQYQEGIYTLKTGNLAPAKKDIKIAEAKGN